MVEKMAESLSPRKDRWRNPMSPSTEREEEDDEENNEEEQAHWMEMRKSIKSAQGSRRPGRQPLSTASNQSMPH